jgi:hypothetical protein
VLYIAMAGPHQIWMLDLDKNEVSTLPARVVKRVSMVRSEQACANLGMRRRQNLYVATASRTSFARSIWQSFSEDLVAAICLSLATWTARTTFAVQHPLASDYGDKS